ncbi:MAG: hypothetical protein LH473_09765 [Chitinophagales bacterium]|nr:hypothetical protein [Chitinophagales bacterium]
MSAIKSFYKFLSSQYQTLFLEYKTEFKPRFGNGKPAHPILQEIINKDREEYKKQLNSFLSFNPIFQQIKTADEETKINELVWNNG